MASPRILCVDIDTQFTSDYFEQLRNAGCEVLTSFFGRQADRAAMAFRPEICLINLKMPDLPGDVIAEQIRSQVKKSPLYFIAIVPNLEGMDQIAEQLNAFHAFLVAPFKPQDLLQLVDSWLLRRAKFQFELAWKARMHQSCRIPKRIMVAVKNDCRSEFHSIGNKTAQ
jgi:DNA-binding response OmpR family regulator